MRSYVTADIPLRGPGMVYKANEEWEAGEFKQLLNLDMVEDGIRVRRHWKNIPFATTARARFAGYASYFDATGGGYNDTAQAFIAISGMQSITGFSGNLDGATAVTDTKTISNKVVAYSGNNLDRTGVFWPFFVFVYNTRTYRIGYRFNSTGVPPAVVWTRDWGIAQDTSDLANPTNTAPVALPTATFSNALPNNAAINTAPWNEFRAGLVWKDRAWVIMTSKVAYSKATDPSEWVVANGAGFFKIPNEIIMDAFIYRDTMILVGKNKIYQFSFVTDPGVDGVLREITDRGGFCGLSAEGNAFISCEDGLYQLNNGFLTLVADHRLNDTTIYNEHKMVLFDDSIFLIKSNYNDPDDITVGVMYSYNLDTGGLSKYTIDGSNGAVIPYDVLSLMEFNGEESLYLLVTTPGGSTLSGTELYYMKANRFAAENQTGVDERSGTTTRNIPWTLEIPSYLTDGLTYQFKKLRHLIFSGFIKPNAHGIDVSLGFTEQDSYQKTDSFVPPSEVGSWRYPRPYRMGIMQRARALSIRLQTTAVRTSNSSLFYLNDLKAIWSPTSRVQSTRYGDDTT